jgi:hypothetical protein
MIPGADKLIPELLQHYPDEPVQAMEYLIDTYQINAMTATHLISIVWNTLHLKYPLNLPTFVINPYGIHKN